MAKLSFSWFAVILVILSTSSCLSIRADGPPLPTGSVLTAEPSADPQQRTLEGPSCPEDFQNRDEIRKRIEMDADGTLQVELGSNPSMPCSWNAPRIDPPDFLTIAEHQQEWPAEGASPQPGAPGLEVYVLSLPRQGKGTAAIPCTCLDEEGAEQEVVGMYTLIMVIEGE